MTFDKMHKGACLVAVFLASCAMGPVSLLEDDKDSDERIRRMNLVVVEATGPEERSATVVEGYVAAHCEAQLDGSCPGTVDTCQGDVCDAQVRLCQALTFREIGLSPDDVLLTSSGGNWTIPPQDAESRAAAFQASQMSAALAMEAAQRGLLSSCKTTQDVNELQSPWEVGILPYPSTELLASTLVEALRVGEASASDGARTVLGVSDRDRTGIADLGRAARLSWFDKNLSRLIAVQQHVGGVYWGSAGAPEFEFEAGDFGDAAVASIGIGSQPPCEGGCAIALASLRQSGADFTNIVDNVTTLDAIAASAAANLNTRFGSAVFDDTDAESFAASLDVSEAELQAAREWMTYESTIYSRASWAESEPYRFPPLADGTQQLASARDATTLVVPTPPPPMHWLTNARATHLWSNAQSRPVHVDSSPRLPMLRPERAHLFAYATAVAYEALNRTSTAIPASAQAVLGSLYSEARARRAVNVEICRAGTSLRVRAYGLPDAATGDELRLVTNLNELRCAEDGVIEGQPCDTGVFTPQAGAWTSVDGFDPNRLSRLDAEQWDLSPGASSGDVAYVVRVRPGGSHHAGEYEAIAGFSLDLENVTDKTCADIPYDFRSNVDASRFTRVDEDSEPSDLCSGLPERLPLEDEIIDDGDPYEDSWQHHLRVAEAAAAHADQLGQQLIQAGLEMDDASERAVDRIQQVCGTHINLDLFGADGELQDIVDGACSMGSCAAGYECVGDQCVLSSILGTSEDSAQRQALEDCLGFGASGAVIDAVALGQANLCLWRRKNEPGLLCTGSDAPCPTVLNPTDTCELPSGLSSTDYEAVRILAEDDMGMVPNIGVVLGLLGSANPAGDPPPGAILPGVRPAPNQCAALDSMRTAGDLPAARIHLSRLRENSFFSYDNIRYWASRIGWRGSPGNYSELTLDGAPLSDNAGANYGVTGASRDRPGVAQGIASTWPCASPASMDVNSQPLFATNVDCTSETSRARMNWRLGRAATTLAALTGVGLSNLRLPAYYNDYTGAPISGAEAAFDVPATLPNAGSSQTATLEIAVSHDFGGTTLNGEIIGPVGFPDTTELWRSATLVRARMGSTGTNGIPQIGFWSAEASTARPMSFLNFGSDVRDDDLVRARAIARRLWEGLYSDDLDQADEVSSGFFNSVLVSDANDIDGYAEMSDRAQRIASRRLFRRALLRATDPWHTPYIDNGRSEVDGQTEIEDLTYLFSAPAWDTGAGGDRNVVHLFGEEGEGVASTPEDGLGAYFTRRDLLDAMELACRVAELEPPPPGMLTDEERPVVQSIADTGNVRQFAERVAHAFDAVARTQVIQDVPQGVVDQLLRENVGNSSSSSTAPPSRANGDYGTQLTQLRNQMRTLGQAPSDMAAILRQISTQLTLMERDQAMFERTVALQFLQLAVDILQSTIGCMNASMSSAGGTQGVTGLAGGICAAHIGIGILKTIMTGLTIENLSDQQQNEFDQFSLRMEELFDALDARRNDFLNATDSVRATLGQLRQSRVEAQSALAEAAFASSSAAGRQYASNTVTRRLYDVNLQRYASARRAAVRSAAIARRAIEQRFGVNLEQQTCAQLVDAPAVWANDVCNAAGVNYGVLRDADAEFDESTIRQLFIGDYVRRLSQYVESYRFDYPYQSGDDTLVLSLRDDVVRPLSECVAPAPNLLGASNDLLASRLPLEDGALGEVAGWLATGCVDNQFDCVGVTPIDGPRRNVLVSAPGADAPRVEGRFRSQPPDGFEVRFAPRYGSVANYVGDYQNGARYTQTVVLPAGLYRLSWYQRIEEAGGFDTYVPTVEARSEGGTTVSGATVGDSGPLLNDQWNRFYRFLDVGSADANGAFEVGVWAATVPNDEEQLLQVAGLQLVNVSGTATEQAYRASSLGDADEPGPFWPTTAQSWAIRDDCELGDPAAFRAAWRNPRVCYQLCSGGFAGRCLDGEEPTEFCGWEYAFTLDEDRLLARGGEFGGGFAFGNYNYRLGDIAVNVVGTGVRACDGANASACYATAGVPYSLFHTPPGGDPSHPDQYTVRAHDGSLHHVSLFDGRIESARALAAERYLSNPLSSADSALISDYVRGEFRGRPMSGNYRIIVWDNGEVDFSAVEDVQLLIRYRYFTRSGNAYECL